MISNHDILPHVRLQFHIEHPVLEECWNDGYDAAVGELTEDDNPFQAETREYQSWNDGWWSGFYGEQRLFTETADTGMLTMKTECLEEEISGLPAVNDDEYHGINAMRWLGRIATVAGVVAVAVAAIELLEIAV